MLFRCDDLRRPWVSCPAESLLAGHCSSRPDARTDAALGRDRRGAAGLQHDLLSSQPLIFQSCGQNPGASGFCDSQSQEWLLQLT